MIESRVLVSSLLPIEPPTSTLPPLTRLSNYSLDSIIRALRFVYKLYFPALSLPSLTSNSEHLGFLNDDDKDAKSPSVDANTDHDVEHERDEDEDYLDALRSDPLERSYTLKWLTGFIARSDVWLSAKKETKGHDGEEEPEKMAEVLLSWAENLLGLFANGLGGGVSVRYTTDHDEQREDEEKGTTRTFAFLFPTRSSSSTSRNQEIKTIQVTLNDNPLIDADPTSVGLQSWGSSIVLSRLICETPARFGLTTGESRESVAKERRLRILELGAGTGLVSIVLAKVFQHQQLSQLEGNRTLTPLLIATDYHPLVLSNLGHNIALNFPSSSFTGSSSRLPIDVHTLDWSSPPAPPTSAAPFNEGFDVIFGADVVYLDEHALLIRNTVSKLLANPSKDGHGGTFWMMVPVRETGRHERRLDAIREAFDIQPVEGDGERRLAVLEEEFYEREDGLGRSDENGYMLFKIG